VVFLINKSRTIMNFTMMPRSRSYSSKPIGWAVSEFTRSFGSNCALFHWLLHAGFEPRIEFNRMTQTTRRSGRATQTVRFW